jgi:small subunit ribosomal protein S3
MGQKVNPISLRLGITTTWDSCWFSHERDFAKNLSDDFIVRSYIKKNLHNAGVSKIVIERVSKKLRVAIHTARPGVVIGKKGADIDKFKNALAKLTDSDVSLNIVELRKPEIDSTLIAESVAQQLERRISFRRAMKKSMQAAMKSGAQGIKISVSGRLGGAEIARTEWYREGRVPLHTLCANIDYGTARAQTTYGIIGVKVWVYKGDIKN